MSTHENTVTRIAAKVGHTIAHLVDDVEPDTLTTCAPVRATGGHAGVIGCSGH